MTRKTGDVKRGDGWIQERSRKDGSLAFVARWREDHPKRGPVWKAKTFDTMDAAEHHLYEIGRAKRSGRYIPDDRRTVTDMVRDYIRRGGRVWKANTVATYTTILTNVIAPAIGDVRVKELTATRCQHFIDAVSRQYSPARVELIRAVITGALKEQVALDAIPKNPMAGVRMPKKTKTERQMWTPAHVAAVMRVVKVDPMLHAYYAVALTTGMRPGEIRALMWDDIDLDAGTVTVRRSITRAENYRPVIGDSTKTGRIRTVAIPPRTVAALKRYRVSQSERRLQAGAWATESVVFDRGDGHPIAQQTFARKHERVIALAGVPHLTPHGMRHVAATLLLEAGVDIKIVSDTLGHKNTDTTRDIYQHVGDELKRTAADVLGAVLGEEDAV